MDVTQLVRLCERWARLGWSVQEQAVAVLVHGEAPDEQNPAAMGQVAAFLEAAERSGVEGAAMAAEDLTQ